MATCSSPGVGPAVPWPCAPYWGDCGLDEDVSQRVLSCTNGAGCSATRKGFVGQEIEGP